MSYAPPDLSVTPPYRPAPYLISGPSAFLTSEELTRYFEDFYSSLEYVNTAPQMVFDRLIGNLSVSVHAAIEKARRTENSGAGITRLEVTAPVVSPPVVPAPIDVEEDVCGTKQHVIRSCTIPDDSTSTKYTEAFLTTGEVYLSRFVIALTSFRMSATSSLRASACVTAPKVTGFNVALSNYHHHPLRPRSGLKSASCSWLELNNQDLDMQCGVWSLPRPHLWEDIGICTTHNISFPFPYGEAPQVLVWFKQIRLHSVLERSLRLQVSDITAVGFTLEVHFPFSSIILALDVSWLACSVGRPGVTIGTFDVEEEIAAWGRCEGYVAFQREWFKAPPRVMVGVTGITIDNEHHLSRSVQVVEVTTEGMKWRIDGGEDEKIVAARGSFIALE